MRTGIVLAVVALVGASASLALASSPAGKGSSSQTDAVTTSEGKPEGEGKPERKGKPEDKGKPRTGEGCKPQVQVILKGILVTPPGAAGTSLTLNVSRANAQGRAYAKGAQPVAVAVDAKTTFRRQGAKAAASLRSGDRVLVQARACKSALVSATAASASASLPAVQLTAVRVIAHPAKVADQGSDTTTTG